MAALKKQSVRVDHYDEARSGLHERAPPLLALPQRLFDRNALSDVHHGADGHPRTVNLKDDDVG
ncbi:MAG: hypothetical protein AAB328_07040, partial [candidate division NC10 bacterium]